MNAIYRGNNLKEIRLPPRESTSNQRLIAFARALTVTMIGMTSIAMTPAAHAQDGSTAASLSELLDKWDRAGFSAPSKPSQSRVYGRNGSVTTGPDYNAMVSRIRSAVSDVRNRRDHDAMTNIAEANRLLGTDRPFILAEDE